MFYKNMIAIQFDLLPNIGIKCIVKSIITFFPQKIQPDAIRIHQNDRLQISI
ncbi:hypothetical protein Hanom_Chr13g01225121 [Helianthus anomalus]